jgi:hypothetical protein
MVFTVIPVLSLDFVCFWTMAFYLFLRTIDLVLFKTALVCKCTSISEWIQYLQVWKTASLILFYRKCRRLAQELMVIKKILSTKSITFSEMFESSCFFRCSLSISVTTMVSKNYFNFGSMNLQQYW